MIKEFRALFNLTRYQGVAFSVLKEITVESKLLNNTGC